MAAPNTPLLPNPCTHTHHHHHRHHRNHLSRPRLAQVGADLHFAGPANQRRGRADSISKIVFQHLARTQPITLQQLQAAAASCEASGAGGIGDKMGSCDSSALVAGSMSVVSADGGASMAVDRPSDGIEVDS